jgi:hypothetical protein
MFAKAVSIPEGAPKDIVGTIASLRSQLRAWPDRAHAITTALKAADGLIATALDLIDQHEIEPTMGLPSEMFLCLEGRRTGADARMLTNAAATLRGMPFTKAAFERGDLSWAQVRAIIASMRLVDTTGRAAIDELVRSRAACASDADPDELLACVDDHVAAIRADLALAREDRVFERRFLAVQGKLDGGATLYGETDADSAASILEALDAAADRPANADDGNDPSRGQQRMDALVAICESSLNGGHSQRPKPRVLATIDVDAFARAGHSEGARLLWSLAGRPARLTTLATESLLCDATVVPVIFNGARPAAVGDATTPISSKLRSALNARDGGCRFPGCRAPVSWCDAHHIRARIHDGPTVVDNLLLLCRRCHRRVHRHRWRITMRDDGTIEFSRRACRYSSTPHARTSARE